MGNSSGGHIAMMSVLFNAHGLCKTLPKVSGVICESGSTDLLICAKCFYYELEESDAHGGAVFYDSAVLDIIYEFCKKCVLH